MPLRISLTSTAVSYTHLDVYKRQVQTQVLYYEDAPAGTSYFAMSNGRTEASEKVWGTALPYLCLLYTSRCV